MKRVVIIGNGISGITAARHIRKQSDFAITVISGETDHFFSRTALMYVYMGHMRYEHTKPYEDDFWKKNRIELVRGWVKQVDFLNKTIAFREPSAAPLEYDILVLATGSVPQFFGWPGQELEGVQGLYSYQDLERIEKNTQGIRQAVVVGGGLIGVELAEMLHSRDIAVTFLVRETAYWNLVLPQEEAELIGRHIQAHGIDLRLNTELEALLPDASGTRVGSVRLAGKTEELPAQFVGIATGVRPNLDWLRGSQLDLDKGILVNAYLETNQPDVYAIGDCAQQRTPPPGRRAMEPIWYTGRIMGETVARTICGTRTAYAPGVFFNSAKFFDIEYHTYGAVPPTTPEGIASFYWQHPTKNIALRLNFDQKNHTFTGVNALGMRLRHESCDRWIRSGTRIGEVIDRLTEAQFDPEFSANHLPSVRQSFTEQFPNIPLPEATIPKHWLSRLFS